jgi:hypothetical protein
LLSTTRYGRPARAEARRPGDYCDGHSRGRPDLLNDREMAWIWYFRSPVSSDAGVMGGSYTGTMMQELHNDGSGRYLVTTATGSHYVLDLTARTVKRKMAGSAPLVDYLDAGFSQLRRDGEKLELLMLETCTVGARVRYWVQVREDHIPTIRMTSPVVRIEALNPSEA